MINEFWLILIGICCIMMIFRLSRGRGYCRPISGYYFRNKYLKYESSAMDILNKRYVNGEISFEDYEKMKKDLGNLY